ncbi:MAG TPA: hypothetical protein VF505_08660 [Thermoanaerobaculia bacterium]
MRSSWYKSGGFAAALLYVLPLFGQSSDDISFQRTFLLRNISGTSFNAGDAPHHPHMVTRGDWTTFWGGALFAEYSTETGPKVQRNELFSTNWIAGAAQHSLGSRGLILFRGRASLEPLTIKERGYPQLLQWISPENGGPTLDVMRAHDLIGEAAIDIAYRTTATSFVHLYAAPVGDPAFGAVPYAQRESSEEFAEAPFAYDVQETTHDSTRVVTAGFGSRFVTLEGSVFHDAVTTGRHTTIDDGRIDSSAARLTITPVPSLALQVSRGKTGDANLDISSASMTIGTQRGAASAIYTQRTNPFGEKLSSGTLEGTIRVLRSTFSGRLESVDRPPGYLDRIDIHRTTHFTLGYIVDLMMSSYRTGIGVNVDYHTQFNTLPTRYGHKPQAIYVFLRVRTEAVRH